MAQNLFFLIHPRAYYSKAVTDMVMAIFVPYNTLAVQGFLVVFNWNFQTLTFAKVKETTTWYTSSLTGTSYNFENKIALSKMLTNIQSLYGQTGTKMQQKENKQRLSNTAWINRVWATEPSHYRYQNKIYWRFP